MAITKRSSSKTTKAPAKKRASSTRKKAAKKTPARGAKTARTRAAKTTDAGALPEAASPTAPASTHDPTSTAGPDAAEAYELRPGARRAVFFDVENTSRAEDVARVLRHLAIDFAHGPLEFTAVGNWRVIGHEPARQLAAHGAALVHSAPSTGVRDWSDLRIAVAAGVWLAGAVAGDVIEIVSDDQAFDAVGDVAASRGVVFRRLSYRHLAGLEKAPERPRREPASRAPRRRRRGGRRNGRRRSGTAAAPEKPADLSSPDDDAAVETAPVDEVVGVVQDLVSGSPAGVTLDDVAAALRARGFRRRAGSARLITRLKLIKDIEVGRDGKIRVAGAATVEPEPDAVSEPTVEVDDAAEPAPGNATRRRRRRRRRPRASSASSEAAAT